MKTDRTSSGKLLCCLFLMLAVFFTSGCGVETGDGGAYGTDGTLSQSFSGRFLDVSDSPLSGVRATLAVNGTECTSDSLGICAFETEALSGDVDLLIEAAGLESSSLRLADVPADAQTVSYQVRLGSSGEAVTLLSLQFDIATEPQPSDTPPVSNTPSNSATPAPTRKPEQAGTPTPAPTVSPASRGRKVFLNTCGTCHAVGKGDGLSAAQLSQTLTLSQHANVRLGSTQLSDLVEFLNR